MRLKVGNNFLDLYDSEVIAQTYAVNEIGDIASRQGGFSNDFIIPLTARNKEILGFPDDINTTSENIYSKVDAELIDGAASVASGFLKFQISSDTNLQASFFADNTNWFTLIKDKKLTDLNLSDLDHDWTRDNIKTAIDLDKETGYTYPLIDYGEFGSTALLEVDFDEMFPCMFVSTIIDTILFDVGWKPSGELIDNPIYKRMVIPFSAKQFNHSSSFVSDNTLTLTHNTGLQVFSTVETDIEFDNVTTFNSTGNSNHLITVRVVGIKGGGGGDTMTVRIKKNAATIRTLVSAEAAGAYDFSFCVEATLLTTDAVTVTIINSGAAPLSSVDEGSVLTLEPQIEILGEGETIQMSSTLPDMKQTDFINYIFFIFGIIPKANPLSKTVIMSFFRSLKSNLLNSIDWSDKLDISKTRQINFTRFLNKYASKSVFTYIEDSNDAELKAYKAETELTFGQGQFDIDNDFISKEKTIYTAPFSPMININSFNNQIYIPQIAFIESGVRSIEPAPKIAILSDNISVTDLTIGTFTELKVFNAAAASVNINSIPFCWFVKVEYIEQIDNLIGSLAFDQVNFSTATGTPLIEAFLEDYESILNKMKGLTAFFNLNEKDIAELDFDIPIYLDRYKSYFYISKVENFKGSGTTTEVEIIKIVTSTTASLGGETWILAAGIWNDDGVWVDTDVWID